MVRLGLAEALFGRAHGLPRELGDTRRLKRWWKCRAFPNPASNKSPARIRLPQAKFVLRDHSYPKTFRAALGRGFQADSPIDLWYSTMRAGNQPETHGRSVQKEVFQTPNSSASLNPHRYPALSHKSLDLLHREFAVVKNACGQHGICAASLNTIGQMCQRAYAA